MSRIILSLQMRMAQQDFDHDLQKLAYVLFVIYNCPHPAGVAVLLLPRLEGPLQLLILQWPLHLSSHRGHMNTSF